MYTQIFLSKELNHNYFVVPTEILQSTLPHTRERLDCIDWAGLDWTFWDLAMPRFMLHVNRRSQSWTYFQVHRYEELPPHVQAELKALGFEESPRHDEGDGIWQYVQNHSGHARMQWNFTIKLLGIGYNFLNDQERERCREGETALMEMHFEESVVEYTRESHGTNLTIKVYNMK